MRTTPVATTTPAFPELAERLIEILTAIHREALRRRIEVGRGNAFIASEISGLGVDALLTCQRLQLLTGLPAPFPPQREVSRMADLAAAAAELIDVAGYDLDQDIQLTIAGVARVQNGVRRYAELV